MSKLSKEEQEKYTSDKRKKLVLDPELGKGYHKPIRTAKIIQEKKR